jgi:hypothetical protein
MKDYWLLQCDCGYHWEIFAMPGFDGFEACPRCGIISWIKDISKKHYPAGTYREIPRAPTGSTRAPARTIIPRNPW